MITKVQSFLRITLPLSLPGVLSGITLVFLPAVSSFFIPRIAQNQTQHRSQHRYPQGTLQYFQKNRITEEANKILQRDYKVTFKTEGYEYMVDTTDKHEVGEVVGLLFGPEDLHIMSKKGSY